MMWKEQTDNVSQDKSLATSQNQALEQKVDNSASPAGLKSEVETVHVLEIDTKRDRPIKLSY